MLQAGDRRKLWNVETVEESKECMTLFVVEQQRSNMTGMQFLLAAETVPS